MASVGRPECLTGRSQSRAQQLAGAAISSSPSPVNPPALARSGLPPPFPPNCATSDLRIAPASTPRVFPARDHDERRRAGRKKCDRARCGSAAAAAVARAFIPAASHPSSASTTTNRSPDAFATCDERASPRAQRAAPAPREPRAAASCCPPATARPRPASSARRDREDAAGSRRTRRATRESVRARELPQRNSTRVPPRNFSAPADRDDADRARARHVRAAARGQVEVFDFDEPQRPAARRLLAERQRRRLLCRREPDDDTGRSSQTMRLASSSAASISAADTSRAEINRRRHRRPDESSRCGAARADRMRQTAHAGPCAAACGRSGAANRSRRSRACRRRARDRRHA